MVDAKPPGAPKLADDDYTDSQIQAWGMMAARPVAKKYGMDKILQQKISERREQLAFWATQLQKGLPLKEVPPKMKTSLSGYMAKKGIELDPNQIPAIYMAGVRALDVSLFGASDFHKDGKLVEGAHFNQSGLQDYLFVLDNPVSRWKLRAVPELLYPSQTEPTTLGQLGSGYKIDMLGLSRDEKRLIIQLVRAKAAINALRPLLGLPRATQQLSAQYGLELPNPVMDDSASGMEKLLAIQREVQAAIQSKNQTNQLNVGEPPPPEGFIPITPETVAPE